MIYRVHAAVSIRRMYVMKTLSASTNSLHGPKNTEQTARKFAGVNVPFQTYFRNPRSKTPTYSPLLGRSFSMKLKLVKTVQTKTMWVQWLLSSKCNDCWNLFLIKLMLFQSVFLVSCYLFAKKMGVIILSYFVYFQILTSVLAVLMTVTVHVLHVQTQWDPLIVRVTVLTLEMAELAIYHQV